MHLGKRMLILTILFVFIASTGAVAVSAQTSSTTTAADANAASSATAPSVSPILPSMLSSERADIAALSVNPLQLPSSVSAVSATAIKPTTLLCQASFQSVSLTDKWQWIHGVLLNGPICLSNQNVKLYYKVGSGAWTLKNTTKTNSVGWVGWYLWSSKAQLIQYKLVYAGTTAYAPAESNIVAVKYEKTPTKPYQTYIWAVAPKPVAAHGTAASFKARLYNGYYNARYNTGSLGGKNVTVWTWNGQKWVVYRTMKTLTSDPGVVLLTPVATKPAAMLLKVTFAGDPSYAASASNTVQLQWT